MRSIILIALVCAAVASASHFSRNRFYNLVNRNQQRNQYNLQDNLLNGYSYADDYNDDIDNDFNRQNMWAYGQGQWDNEFDGQDIQDAILRGNLYNQEQQWENNQFDGQDIQDAIRNNLYNQQQQWVGNQFDGQDIEDSMIRNNLYNQQQQQQQQQWEDNKFDGQDLQDSMIRNNLYNQQQQWEDNDQLTSGSPVHEVRDANRKLASRLYKQTKEDKDDKNTVVSPLSIQLALAALNKGARGNTKRQIGRVIGGRASSQERRQVLNALARQVRQQGRELSGLGQSTRINPVTIIAINQRTPAQQHFIQKVRNQQGAQVKHCNFQNQPQQSRQMINSLVSRRTNMKINQIVPRDAITDNTKMVLVNALEMKAPWGRQMRNHVTKEAQFYPLDTNKVKVVEVMETQGRFKYYEDQLVKVVGIPTQQHELTFYTIVPKHKDGLTAVEKLHLQDSEQLKQILQQADQNRRQVGVQLPKFQIKHKIDVRRTLQKQGVTDAFDPQRADFSGITGVSKNAIDEVEDELNNNRLDMNNAFNNQYDLLGQNLGGLADNKPHLNKFIHQATIKVTENGITSATQSGSQYDSLDNLRGNNFNQLNQLGGLDMDQMNTWDVSGLFQGNTMGQKMVKANRAFAFAVKHNPTNQLVLVGRVIDAAQKNVHTAFQTINNVDQL